MVLEVVVMVNTLLLVNMATPTTSSAAALPASGMVPPLAATAFPTTLVAACAVPEVALRAGPKALLPVSMIVRPFASSAMPELLAVLA